MMGNFSEKLFHRLENIEDVEEFYAAIDRKHLNKSLSPERPYSCMIKLMVFVAAEG